jgi:hypothetical protein
MQRLIERGNTSLVSTTSQPPLQVGRWRVNNAHKINSTGGLPWTNDAFALPHSVSPQPH